MPRNLGYLRPMKLIRGSVVFFLFLFFLTIVVNGQPGGGGGAQFKTFIASGKRLSSEEMKSEVQVYKLSSFHTGNVLNQYPCDGHIPPPEIFFEETLLDRYRTETRHQNTRWVWIHASDTMTIDFLSVLAENGAGHIEYFDTLEFQKGYFSLSLGQLSEERIRNGFTKKNKPIWIQNGLAVENLKLPSPLRLEFSFFSNETTDALARKKYIEARQLLETSESFATTKETRAAWLLQAAQWAHETGDSELALSHIEERKAIVTDERNDYWFRTLLVALDRNAEALKYYEKGRSMLDPYFDMEVALFKEEKLNDTEGALEILQRQYNAIPVNHLTDRPMGTSEYAALFYTIGKVCLHRSEHDKKEQEYWRERGLHYLLLAAQFNLGSGFTSRYNEQPEFKMYRHHWQMQLCYAFSMIYNGPYMGWGEETKNQFLGAIEYADEVIKKQPNNLLAHYAKAYAAYLNKSYSMCESEIEIVLKADPTNPRGILIKLMLLGHQGKIKEANELREYYHTLKHKPLIPVWR